MTSDHIKLQDWPETATGLSDIVIESAGVGMSSGICYFRHGQIGSDPGSTIAIQARNDFFAIKSIVLS